MKNLKFLVIMFIVSVLLFALVILNWVKIGELKTELNLIKNQQSELKTEYDDFKTVANDEIVGMWRSLARVRKNFIALKYNGIEGIDYGKKMQAKISH